MPGNLLRSARTARATRRRRGGRRRSPGSTTAWAAGPSATSRRRPSRAGRGPARRRSRCSRAGLRTWGRRRMIPDSADIPKRSRLPTAPRAANRRDLPFRHSVPKRQEGAMLPFLGVTGAEAQRRVGRSQVPGGQARRWRRGDAHAQPRRGGARDGGRHDRGRGAGGAGPGGAHRGPHPPVLRLGRHLDHGGAGREPAPGGSGGRARRHGHGPGGGGRHAAGRCRLPCPALRRRDAPGAPPSPRRAGGPARAGPRSPVRALHGPGGKLRRHPARPRHHRQDLPVQDQRPHPRRERDRQGAHRPGAPRARTAPAAALRAAQLRHARPGAPGERAVRPRAGRLHRRRRAEEGALRAGRRRHALPRRDRRDGPGHAGQAAARAGAERVSTGRRHRQGQGRPERRWRPPTGTSRRPSGPASSARTSTTGSRW